MGRQDYDPRAKPSAQAVTINTSSNPLSKVPNLFKHLRGGSTTSITVSKQEKTLLRYAEVLIIGNAFQ